MEHYELPLVIFTVLSQMSVGMALLLTWGTLRGTLITTRMHWLVTGLVLAVASIAAVLHLAHPDRAYDALRNLKHAWLSREIWICPYISRHLLSLNPLLARCRRYSRGER